MNEAAQTPAKQGFFGLPAELRLMIYERYCDKIQQDLLDQSNGRSDHPRACRRRSYADTMHVLEFQYQQSPYGAGSQNKQVESNPAYDRFVDMKLVCRQMRAEFAPVWLRRWAFQLPRPIDPKGEDLYPAQDDPDDFREIKIFLDGFGHDASKHVRRLRLTRHLQAQSEPETALEAETAEKLRTMLHESDADLHDKAVVHVQVRCSDVWPSNRRASKDVLFGLQGQNWMCICDGPTTTSFERGWA